MPATTRSMPVKLIVPELPPVMVPAPKSTTTPLVARSLNSIESVPVPPSITSSPPVLPATKRSLPPRPLMVSLPRGAGERVVAGRAVDDLASQQLRAIIDRDIGRLQIAGWRSEPRVSQRGDRNWAARAAVAIGVVPELAR